jgi:hypothetical protein
MSILRYQCSLRIFYSLSKLLLDEERPQMAQLPRARDTEYSELDERPPYNLAIRGFALVSEFCFSFLRHVSIVFLLVELLGRIPSGTPAPS